MQVGSSDETRQWLRSVCRDAGITITELARRAEISPSTLTRFLNGPPDAVMLSGRTLHKLRAAGERIAQSVPAASRVQEERSEFRGFTTERVRLLQLELAPAGAQGPSGSENLELVRPDPSWHGGGGWPEMEDDHHFSVYVPGDSMRPRFRSGERLVIARGRPPAIGSDVLVQFVSTPEQEVLGAIAELVDRDRNQIRLSQLHDGASGVIHRSHVRNVFPVVGMFRSELSAATLQFDGSVIR